VHRARSRTSAAGFRVAVVDLFEITQPAVADWRQQCPGRADIGIALGVVSEFVLAEEALAHRRATLGLGNMRDAAGLLAGLDVLGLEVAAVGDDVDGLDPQNFAGRLGGLRQQAHVDDLVGHRLFDDQLVFRIDGDLDIVADVHFRVRGHRPAVGIGQRDLIFAGSLQTPDDRLIATTLRLQGGDLFGELLGARPAVRRAVLSIALVEAFEIFVQPFVGGAHELAKRTAGVVAILVVDRLDAGSVNRQQLPTEEVEPPAQQHELAENSAKRRAIVAPEVRDRLEVGLEAAQQPHDLDVASTLAFKPPARANPVEVAVNVELHKIAGRVARPPRRLRLDPSKSRRRKIETVNKGVDEPNRIVHPDAVVNRLRQ